MLKIRLFGNVIIEYDNERLDSKLSNKTIALIYLLVLNKGKDISKDTLRYYLWPKSSEEAARSNLRYNLWVLKKVIPLDENGEPFVLGNQYTCTLNDKYKLDCDYLIVKEIDEKTASIEELTYAKDLLCGNIMEGWYLKDCNEVNETILSERMYCEMRRTRIMDQLASKYEQQTNYGKALEILIEESRIEPDNENIAKHIMNLFAEHGKRSEAISYYNSYKDNLWKSLETTPSQEMENLYMKIYNTTSVGDESAQVAEDIDGEMILDILCLKEVDYFALSEVISKLCAQSGDFLLSKVDKFALSDLTYVCASLCTYCYNQGFAMHVDGSEVPSVRVVQGATEIVETALKYYKVTINLHDYNEIDSLSNSFFKHLNMKEGNNLTINKM